MQFDLEHDGVDVFERRGREMMAGNPAYPVLSSYMHWTAPNTVACANAADWYYHRAPSRLAPSALMARPRRTACTPAA